MYIRLCQSLSFAIYFASALSCLGDEPVWTDGYSDESGDGASQHPEQPSTLAYPWASTEVLNISVNGQSPWNDSGATPVRSEDTRDLNVNETPLLPPIPEWCNRSVYVPRPPLYPAASTPQPRQLLSGREVDTGPHQSKSAASRHGGQKGTEPPQNPTNLGQRLVFGLDMQPRPARSRRLSSQQKRINTKRRSHGWQTCERHKRSKKFCPCNVPAVELEKLAQASTSYASGRGSPKQDENTSAESMHAEELRPPKRHRIGQIDTIRRENHESLITTFLKMRDPNSHDPLASLVESTTDSSSSSNYSRPLRFRVNAEEHDVAPVEDYYTYPVRAQDESQLDLSCETEGMYRNSKPSSRLTRYPGSADLLSIPDRREITREQLANEVKGIYAGLAMVEKKCVEIDSQKSGTTGHFSNDRLQSLITWHRNLLHEHHDFLVTHPSTWDDSTADYAQEHSTGYFDLQAHRLEHFSGPEDLGLVPEGFNDNDPGLEAGNKSVRDQCLEPGEPRPLSEDFSLGGQVYASYWHDPELGGDLPCFSRQLGSGQEAPQSTVDNPDEIAFNEWTRVDGYDDMDLGLFLHDDDALSPVQADTMPSNDDYLPGMDWTVQFCTVPNGTAEILLNVIREGTLSEERGDSDITRNEKRHKSQNVKACCHNNLFRTETDVDRTEKAANTVTADLVMADFARHIPKTTELKSVIPNPEIVLQSKLFHLPKNTTNHCASLDTTEQSNKNCNNGKVGTATELPVIAERLESGIKATANVTQYPLKAVPMIFTLIFTFLTQLGQPIDGVSALPTAMHMYGRLLAEKSRHVLQHMPSPRMSLSLLGLILGPGSDMSSIRRQRRQWRRVIDLWTVCFYVAMQPFQGCGRLRW